MQSATVIHNEKLRCIASHTPLARCSTPPVVGPVSASTLRLYARLLTSCPPAGAHASSRKPSLAALAASHALQRLYSTFSH